MRRGKDVFLDVWLSLSAKGAFGNAAIGIIRAHIAAALGIFPSEIAPNSQLQGRAKFDTLAENLSPSTPQHEFRRFPPFPCMCSYRLAALYRGVASGSRFLQGPEPKRTGTQSVSRSITSCHD
jgi:hypothetical protein